MKRLLICAAWLFGISGVSSASSVISCGGTTALLGTTTCSNSLSYSTVLQTFSLDLQWNSASDVTSPTLSATNPSDPASASGAAYNTTWDSVGLPVMLGISGSMLELTDNYVDVQRGVNWKPASMYPGMPQPFEGTFAAPPDTAASSGTTPGSPGDYLLGSANGTAITVQEATDSTPLTSFGFRIASEDLTSFDVVIKLLGADGSVLETLNAGGNPGLGGGGLCMGLAAQGSAAPVPCNTAPFIAVAITGNNVYGFSVVTTNTGGGADSGGFFIDTLFYNDVPEPASVLLTGIGLASLLAFIRRRNRRQA